MKLLVGAIIVGAAATAFGQEALAPIRATLPARVATDVIVTGVMKQAPFTADESGETVRVMPDGNRIVENWTGKMARNSQGKVRRDITSGKVGGDGAARPFIFGSGAFADGLVALAPGATDRHVYLSKIDAENGATRAVIAPAAEGSGATDRHIYLSKIEGEHAATRAVIAPAAEGSGVTVVTSGGGAEARAFTMARIEATTAARAEVVALGERAEAMRIALPKPVEEGKFQTRKETLGTRDFGGVSAEGVRVITTFLPGAVGNEKEIEVSSETWFAKDLGVIVYSKRIDPRFGETTYQMTNINRSEPDPSLFPGIK